VFRAGKSESSRITKNRRGQLEGDPMLPQVGSRLRFIPLELELVFMQADSLHFALIAFFIALWLNALRHCLRDGRNPTTLHCAVTLSRPLGGRPASLRRAAQGEFVRPDAEIYGQAGGKERS
jgi:hypothetical protein